MFKTQRTSLKFHPIATRLVQYKQLLEQMESLDNVMAPEIDRILKAANKGSEGKHYTKTLKKMVQNYNAVPTSDR